MDKFLSYARAQHREVIGLIRRLVECESPSGDTAALTRMADLLVEESTDIAKIRRLRGGHLLMDFALPGARKKGRILGLGHFDTVWPIGALRRMPFRQRQGRLWGPGVLDMKSGVAFFLSAMRALRELDVPVARRVSLLLVNDEETGSASSRPVTEREAARSEAVLVLECATGLDGKLKTARKGVGHYRVTVHGVAAHSGIDFTAGASAVVELARQVEKMAGFTDLRKGVTVNPGVITGGTRVNVIAEQATVEADLRIGRLRDAPRLDQKFRSLKPFDKRCRVEVSGGLNRPPMERTAGVARLFKTARKLAAELGVNLEESATGGASDGNFTGALGIPTLDGLGGVGEGAHASHESILVNRIDDRIALIAKLAAAL